jgi:hypothetical protein
MSDHEEEERPAESGKNPTQERMDEEGTEGRPVDVDWEETEPTPHQGEEGQQVA